MRVYGFIIRVFTLLDVTPGEKSVVVLVPSLCKEEFVGLGWTVMAFCHAATLLACRLSVFDAKNKTHYSL